MCGIAGIWDPGARAADKLFATATAMQNALVHRGPDAAGVWTDAAAGLALAHRRLSILDLSEAGAQPMLSVSQRYALTYNGEIYNFETVRSWLQAAGWNAPWRGHSDTEVLLAAIEHWGLQGALDRIDGMFAFAIWDRKLRQLTLVRDAFGEKPLYYGLCGGRLLFGSELSSLAAAAPQGLGDYDPQAVAVLLRSMCIPAPLTIYRTISKLPPSQHLVISERDVASRTLPAPVSYWSASSAARAAAAKGFDGSREQADEHLAKLLEASVRDRLMADVPVGAMLSGGIDSSVICAFAQSLSKGPLRTFTIGFGDPAYDESSIAAEVACHLGTDHTTVRIGDDQVLAIVPDMHRVYDEPFADSSQLNTAVLSQALRREVTVALSGDAGDELFGGYVRYRSAPAIWSRLRKVPLPFREAGASALRRLGPDRIAALLASLKGAGGESAGRLWKGLALVGSRSDSDMYRRLLSVWGEAQPPGDAGSLATLFEDPDLSFARRMMLSDTIGYLPSDILTKVDRAAMWTSLETRIPFLNREIFEFAWSLPDEFLFDNNRGKLPLRRIAARFLPEEVLDRPKRGFAAPLGAWLRGPLREWADDLLRNEQASSWGMMDPDAIQQAWQVHQAGKWDQSSRLWPVLMFESWHRNRPSPAMAEAA